MPISLSSYMTSKVLDQWTPKGVKWKREEGKPRERIETHERQFLALITESDGESSGIYIDTG